jgi:hypothetical protein
LSRPSIVRTIQASSITSLAGIAEALNARGVRTARGGAWHTSTVNNLLSKRRLDFLSDRLARCGAGKFLPRVMGGGGRGRQAPTKRLLLEQVSGDWPVSTDPSVHVEVLKKLFDSDVTIVNVHSGQPNQQKGIEFYANNVPPDSGTARSPIARLAILEKLAVGGGMAPPDVWKSAVQLF